MDNKEYSQRAEHVFRQVEQLLDRHEDLLTTTAPPTRLQIAFEDVLESLCSIPNELFMKSGWRATPGQHFKYQADNDRWFAEAEQEEFYDCFARLLSDHLGKPTTF